MALTMMNTGAMALLILDIQDDFTGPHARMPVDPGQTEAMIQNINNISGKIGNVNVSFVYIGNEFNKWDFLNIFRNFAAIKGSPGTKMDERLKIRTGEYFSKSKPSAFSNPELDRHLKSLNVKEVAIAGLKAEACVSATVKAALRLGYRVVLLEDCIATTSTALKNKTIKKLKSLHAEIRSSSDLFSER